MNKVRLQGEGMKVRTYGAQLENMKEYRIASSVNAIEMDRDTAGRKGYLVEFSGSDPKDTTPGYSFSNPLTGMIEWTHKDVFERALLKNDPWVETVLHSAEINKAIIRETQDNKKSSTCRNCTRWDEKGMYCETIYTHTTGAFGCIKFQRNEG